MDLTIRNRLKKAFNVFMNRDPTASFSDGPSSYFPPDRPRLTRGNERSMVNSVFNRIALDVSSMEIIPCTVDKDDRFQEPYKNGLYNCLTLEANIDQTGRAFLQDAVISMLDEGCVALVPVDTDRDPNDTTSFDIETIRVGKITQWKPTKVLVNVYNDRTGLREDIWVNKRTVAIVESPLFTVINEPNAILQRLMRKLALLDIIDENNCSGKLDIIIQLPYTVRSDVKKREAEKRRRAIENQLVGSKYGIAYIDGTERITQLNRPVENTLMTQVEYFMDLFWSQLGITKEIMNGTADEKVMLNYYNRTIEPIVAALVDAMKRTFLSKTARSQGKSIKAFRDPFRLVPVGDIAEIADKFTRNEVMTTNEIRQEIGMRPSKDPKADVLVNSNIKQPNGTTERIPTATESLPVNNKKEGERQNE